MQFCVCFYNHLHRCYFFLCFFSSFFLLFLGGGGWGETMLGYFVVVFCFFVCSFVAIVVFVCRFCFFVCFRSSFAYCKCIRVFCLLRQSTGSGCENEGVYLIHVQPSLSAHPPSPLSRSLHPHPAPPSLCVSPPPSQAVRWN